MDHPQDIDILSIIGSAPGNRHRIERWDLNYSDNQFAGMLTNPQTLQPVENLAPAAVPALMLLDLLTLMKLDPNGVKLATDQQTSKRSFTSGVLVPE